MERLNPFVEETDNFVLPTLAPKVRTSKPVDSEVIAKIATEHNFPSRSAPKPKALPPAKRRRTYTTGRNQQLNLKVTAETVDRFYRLADEQKVPLCALLEKALDALEKQAN